MKLEIVRMKTTFKKTLLAVSLAAVAGFAQAAVVTVPGATTISQEGAVGQTNIALPNVTVTLAAEYTVNDTITFTLTGAEFDTAASTPSVAFTATGTDTATLGFLSSTATTVTFRVTSVNDTAPAGVVFSGGTFVLSGMQLKTTSVTANAGAIKVAYSALTNNNQSIDNTGTLSATAATVIAQFSSSVTKALNGIIDVENSRQQFTAGNDTITTDVLVVTPVEAAVTAQDAAYTGAVHTIKGDFSWMNTNATAGVDAGELAAAFAATGGADTYASTINTAMDTITVTVTDAAGNTVEPMTATFTVAGVGANSAVLNPQDFKISSTIKYNTAAAAAATKATATDAAAGSWTLNGSVVRVPYMVMKDGRFGTILNVTNHSTKSGAIVIDVFAEDGTKLATNYAAGTSNAGSVTSIADKVRNALIAAGKDVVNSNVKYSVQITTNVPASDVMVYAAYTDAMNGGERAIVNNDSKVQVKGL
jgi:hypothetical protein